MVWSPLAGGYLTGKVRRNQPPPEGSRQHQLKGQEPPIVKEMLYDIVDALDDVASETGKTPAQIALNWLLQRPTVASVIIGARNEAQLQQNLDAFGWNLGDEQVAKLDAASDVKPIYPYWHQRGFIERNPLATARS